jgi:hypothetical protein
MPGTALEHDSGEDPVGHGRDGQTLYGHVRPNGVLRPDGERLLAKKRSAVS